MTLYKWSQTAASNATADPSINWQEGQAPSSVNDSARAMMASVAKHRDDIAGAIVTGGTSTAYTVTSYEAFDTLARLGGQIIAFTPHATNGAVVTLNVDSLGAKPLRSAPGVELQAGVLIQGSPYVALYNHSEAVWYLQNFFVSLHSVPVGGMIDYIGITAPNSAFVLPNGQAISRTTYSTLFAIISTTYGPGDGSTTFNIPDLRGRVVAGKDDMGGSSANRLTNGDDGLNGDSIGAVGGGETQTLVTANLPAYTPSGSIVTTGTTPGQGFAGSGSQITDRASQGSNNGGQFSFSISAASTFTGTPQGGASQAFGIVQPTIVLSKILRVL